MITILCAGSRGDFQPYIALAQQLIKEGKEVQIAGNVNFKDFITGYGIGFYPISVDLNTLDIDPKMLEDAGSADNPLKMILVFNKMKRYGEYTSKEYFEACKESELIIYHPGCTIGYFAAKKLGIPAVLASPFPMHKTNEYLSVVMYGKSKSTKLTKKISYAMIQGMLWMASKSSIKSFWKKEFGNIPENFGAPFEYHKAKASPALVSCSNHIFKRPNDWNENIHQKGYWFVEESESYTPDKSIVDFLNAGEKPIYIGFGSMSIMKQHDKLGELVIDAIEKSGKRAIICGFGKPDELTSKIYAIDSIPHSWLFQHVSAVCHHGGAGTSAAGFSAGVPSIIVPFSNDQFAWAHRSFDLGIGVKPIYASKLTSENLSKAIIKTGNPDLKATAKRIGQKIRSENGAKDCARVIIELLEKGIV